MAEQIDFQTHFDEESESLRRTLEEMRKEAEEEIMRLSSRLAERDYDPDSSVVTATERLALQQEMMVLQQSLEAKGQALDHITEECRRLEDELEDQHIIIDGLKQEVERKSRELEDANRELDRLHLEVERLERKLIEPPPPPPSAGTTKDTLKGQPRNASGARTPWWIIGLLSLFIALSASMLVLLYLIWGHSNLRLSDLLQRTPTPPPAATAPVPVPAATPPADTPVQAPPRITPATPLPSLVRDRLRSGASGPAMLRFGGGSFKMGSNSLSGEDFSPAHLVTVGPFLIGAYEVTYQEYDRFARATGRTPPKARGDGRAGQPVAGVSWDDAQAYANWLSQETGQRYRLPSEAEWEFAARAGTETSFWWGYTLEAGRAVCLDCGTPWDNRSPAPVGSFPPNPFGLYDTAGNLMEWVADCYHPGYLGAPSDGRPRGEGNCTERAARGGAFDKPSASMRPFIRAHFPPASQLGMLGFRIARDA